MVSIRQWPLSVASGWLWQSEADQCHSNPRKIQQLRLGDTIPHALQWHWKKLETLSPRREYLGESIVGERHGIALQIFENGSGLGVSWSRPLRAQVRPGEGLACSLVKVDVAVFLFLCVCALWHLLREKRSMSRAEGGGKMNPTPLSMSPSHPTSTPCLSLSCGVNVSPSTNFDWFHRKENLLVELLKWKTY